MVMVGHSGVASAQPSNESGVPISYCVSRVNRKASLEEESKMYQTRIISRTAKSLH